jgi:asparagine synthase (glutamine-hydrolysing)
VTAEEVYRASALEVASGLILGPGLDVELPRTELGLFDALERAVLAGLERPPCFVSFSGGRDSSAILGVATRAARRAGLPPPIPVTMRFPSAAQTEESDWQELVVNHLGLEDWVRIEPGDELDVVGPAATAALRTHGLLWPPNAHMHVPVLRAAAGGSLLTGIGGDELFAPSRWSRALAVLERRARPRLSDLPHLAHVCSPRPVRHAVHRWRHTPPTAVWLRTAARDEVRRSLLAEAASEPLRWRGRIRRLAGLRYAAVGERSLTALAGDWAVRIEHPFRNLEFLGAVAALPRADRFTSRTDGMRRLFGGILPPELLARPTKAEFGHVLWSGSARALAKRWQGEGVDTELVDPDVLRAVWSGPEPDPGSYLLLQKVFLELDSASTPGELEQTLARRG